MSTALLWYRRDLRVHDHPALTAAHRDYDRVIPVFIFDDALLRGRFASSSRTAFLLGCLRELDGELRHRGSALAVRSGPAERVLVDLVRETGADAVLWTSDVSPFARHRDRRVSEALRDVGAAPRPQGGNYVVDVGDLRSGQGGPYSVFSPFHRAWRSVPRREVHAAPRRLVALPPGLDAGSVPGSVRALGLGEDGNVAEPAVAAGEAAAREAARRWLAGPVDHYAERHNGVARRGTSQLSPYLRWGCLSPLELERRAATKGGQGAEAFIRQLGWRDFYAHVLLHWPENVRVEFQPRFRQLEWADAPEHLEAWQRGETGYPLVDAGMRQLAQTGWMHNRARLVVGSFLTKDLHLDWRQGEQWFERLLLDGEPAQNNGNWQWIASVGTDPAPAFRRMFNPTLQGQRFDPQGEYVRRWVPELARVSDERLFEPWELSERDQRAAGCVIGRDYPPPVVEHSLERQRALARYRAAGEQAA